MFCEEIKAWIANRWMVEHDKAEHGKPKCILPLFTRLQEHKPDTPAQPGLDYRKVNECLKSTAGVHAPAFEATLCNWRKAGDPNGFALLDVKKAYLQVGVAPELRCFQTVVWKGKMYIMSNGIWSEHCS